MTTTSPPALAYSTDNCTVGRTMAILGERWTFVVIREVFNGVRRFADIREHASMPRQVLSDRLALLLDHGILRKEPYQPPGEVWLFDTPARPARGPPRGPRPPVRRASS